MRLSKEERLLSNYVKYLDFDHPGLLYCHIPNEGKRNPLKVKILGIRAGAPDVILFEPRGKYRGLAVELKVDNNTLSPAQLGFLEKLRSKGWRTIVCYTIEDAVKKTEEYLNEY